MTFKIKIPKKIKASTAVVVITSLFVLLTYSFPFSSYLKHIVVFGTTIYFLAKNLSFRVCSKNMYVLFYILFGIWATSSFLWASYPEGVRAQVFNMWVAISANIIMTIYIVSHNQNLDEILSWLFPVMIIYLIEALFVGKTNAEGRFSASGAVNQFGITTGYVYLITLYALRKKKIPKTWAYFLIGLAVILTLLTGSRKSLINLIIYTCMIFLFEKNDKNVIRNFGKVIGILLIAILFVVAIFTIAPLYNVVGKRFASLLAYFNGDVQEDLSALRRAYMKQDAIELFLQHPIFGIGLNNFKYVARYDTYAHSDPYEILCCLGIIGGILYFVPFVIAFVISFVQWKKNYPDAVVPFAAFLSMLINELSNVAYMYGIIHIFLGIFAGMLFVNQRRSVASKNSVD